MPIKGEVKPIRVRTPVMHHNSRQRGGITLPMLVDPALKRKENRVGHVDLRHGQGWGERHGFIEIHRASAAGSWWMGFVGHAEKSLVGGKDGDGEGGPSREDTGVGLS